MSFRCYALTCNQYVFVTAYTIHIQSYMQHCAFVGYNKKNERCTVRVLK